MSGGRALSRHVFQGSFTAEGVAEVATWNEKVVLIADPESAWELRTRLGCPGFGDLVVEVDIRCDSWAAVVDTLDWDGH